MPKKSDNCYLQNFIECVECGYQAARIPEGNLNRFDTGLLQDKLDGPHRIEYDADKKKHEMMAVLVKVFITPIEREDIIFLSQDIDEVTNKIEGVLTRIYIDNIQRVRPKALAFIKVTIRCCEASKEVMEEFADFGKSKALHGLIIEINVLEKEGDSLFIDSIRSLHAEVTDPIGIIAWRRIYIHLEKCCDACEHVADVVGSVITKSTQCPAAATNAWEAGPAGHMVLTDRLKSWKNLISMV